MSPNSQESTSLGSRPFTTAAAGYLAHQNNPIPRPLLSNPLYNNLSACKYTIVLNVLNVEIRQGLMTADHAGIGSMIVPHPMANFTQSNG